MSFIQNFFTSRDNNTDGNTYVGQEGRLWYNPDTNSIYVNTANIAGGTPVALATNANITANIITVNTITSTSGDITVTGNLVISGNISPAAPDKIGGIYPGPGVVISNTGELTIDTANLPLSFGNFTASNNVLSIVNVDEDMILQTEGNAEIQLVGNVGFYKPDGLPPDPANLFAFFNSDGQVSFYVPESDPVSGAIKIIGSASGQQINPAVAGVMLHITGQPNAFSTIYNDAANSFPNYIGRRYNGNVTAPTQVTSGQTIVRFSGQGYTNTGFTTSASGSLSLDALENFTATNQGTAWRFLVNPVAGNVRQEVANVTVANGVSATQFNTTGNVTSGNVTATNISTTKTQKFTAFDIGDVDLSIPVDFNNGSLQYANLVSTGNPTVTLSNLVPGQVLTLIIKNTSGTNRNVTHGCTALNATTGQTVQAVNNNRIGIFKYYSVDATTANCRIGFE